MKNIISLCITLLFLAPAHAGLLFNYSQLALKDLDQMNKMVLSKITESHKSGGNRAVPLKEAVQAVLSRPNEDNMTEKIMPQLRTELDELNAWEHSIQGLVKEAIGALRNPKAFKPVIQVTYQIFLENLLSEMKPHVDEKFENRIITQIRDAKIEVTKEAANERRLRMMKESASPSVIAEEILKEYEERKKNPPPVTEAAPKADSESASEDSKK